jgi:spore coat protein CotH
MKLKYRRHYTVFLILIAILAFFVFALGGQRVIAYTTRSSATITDPTDETKEGFDYSNDVDLFDDSLVHSVRVIMDVDEYDEMISTYQNTGLKEYFRADIIIDGVRVPDVIA